MASEAWQTSGPTIARSDVEAALRWVDPVLGAHATSIRLLLLDEESHARVVFEQGPEVFGGNRSLRRREAIVSRRPCVITSRRTPGVSVAILPLVRQGEVLGLLEIVAQDFVIGERLSALEAVSEQTALVIGNLTANDSMPARIDDATDEIPELLKELLAAASQDHAVAAVVRFWHRAGVPAVAWWRAQGGHAFEFVASRGVDRETKQALRRRVDASSAETIIASAIDVMEGALPLVTRARDAVVLLRDPAIGRSTIVTVEAGLGLALDRLALSATVADLVRSIDEGLAWTAHELRSPLLGVERAIDSLDVSLQRLPDREREVLGEAREELHRLTGMVEDVLRWSVGTASIRRRPTDLARLIEESARAVSVLEGSRRLTVESPEVAMVCVDPQLVRIAVENLLRNSLQHAVDDIDVSVDVTASEVTVSVSDAGPGVPSEERAVIFEPFVRGRSAVSGGRGLGLFIAQRVVQAHGGSLWLEPAAVGSVFRMRFPKG